MTKLTTENVYLCYKNSEDQEEFTPICDVLEFGAPVDEDDCEMELMHDHLCVWSEEQNRFVVLF